MLQYIESELIRVPYSTIHNYIVMYIYNQLQRKNV